MKVAIHDKTVNPVYGDGVIYVEINDEAAGPFVVLTQNALSGDPERTGKVCFDYATEWPAVFSSVQSLMTQQGIKD